jgi:putative spermidine/putrescine transport system permease protein
MMADSNTFRTHPERIWHVVERLVAVCVLGLLFVPVLVILPISFSAGSMLVLPTPGYSLQWYREIFTSSLWMDAARNSFFTAGVAALLALILGTLAALGIHKIGGWPKRVLSALALAPMLVPIAIVGVAIYFFFARIGLVHTYTGIIMGLTLMSLPYVIIPVSAALEKYNRNMTWAAASLGAHPLKAFFTVTLPLIAPGIISGGLFAFAIAFDELVIPLFIAAPEQQTLPRVIFSGIQENVSPAVAAASVFLCSVTLILMGGAELLRRRMERVRNAVPDES